MKPSVPQSADSAHPISQEEQTRNDLLPSPLRAFIEEVEALLDAQHEEQRFLPGIGESMRKLVASDNWLDPAFAQPHPEYYQQYLLYAAPKDRFSIVSFVWGPGQSTPIHDHTVWGVIGMLRGAECTQGFELAADGTMSVAGTEVKLLPGDVGFVSPRIGDVHKVRNAFDDRVSVSIHAYGGNIGNIRRHVFPVGSGERRDFVSGYANAAQ